MTACYISERRVNHSIMLPRVSIEAVTCVVLGNVAGAGHHSMMLLCVMSYLLHSQGVDTR
eukprot:36897-Eustigmatos_ZCMA.PRE.1